MIVVADASPLICFAILGKLETLDIIFEDLIVPEAVYNEIAVFNKPFSNQLSLFLLDRIKEIKNKTAVKLLRDKIDPGEAESIVLALELGVQNVFVDDFNGRRAARLNGLIPIGTIGALLRAKKLNLIEAVKPCLDRLIQNRIRIGKALYQKALIDAGEAYL